MAIVFRYKTFSYNFSTQKEYEDLIHKMEKEKKPKSEIDKIKKERNSRFTKDGTPRTPTSTPKPTEPEIPKVDKYTKYTKEEWEKLEENLKKKIQSDATKKELEAEFKKGADSSRGWKGLSTKNKILLGAGSAAALGTAGLIGHALTRTQRD